MSDTRERLENFARCLADTAAEGANVIDPDTRMTLTVSISGTQTGQMLVEAVAFSEDFVKVIASVKAPEPALVHRTAGELHLVDEYADANVDPAEVMYANADSLLKSWKEGELR